MGGHFERLSPFIREYVYRNEWEALNEIQEKACHVIFDTDDHLILSSGTATGKTEAAFLPALTVLENDRPSSMGILYIAPMKALLNDQFYRLDALLAEADIPVSLWHGDVLRSRKEKVLTNPAGILQITPESLESMLIHRNRDLARIFGDLRFVIIDEIHSFMGADRGIQVQCQLARLEKYIRQAPRRIGLSATLGDYQAASDWLSAGTNRGVSVVTGKKSRQIRLSVEHFTHPVLETDMSPFEDPAWGYLYEKTLGKRAIIFSNGRETADAVIANMKYMAAVNGDPDIYHVHHGSISGPLREEAESDMKSSGSPVVTGATVTLEMGIDIGSLERVIQIGPPVSVTSLVQRLGRSGRRGNPPEMFFTDWEYPADRRASVAHRIPWRLLQIIAMLQLYLEEGFMETPRTLKYPLSMLYHQIMSGVAEAGELSPRALFQRVSSLACFRHISPEDFQGLLFHLLEMGHLQTTEERGVIIGLEGEKIINSYQFYAVFPEEEEWAIMEGSKKIGTVEIPVPPGKYLTIAGYTWIVLSVDNNKRLVFVEKTKRKIQLLWYGDRAIVHDRILKRMRRALFEDTVYPYLKPAAAESLAQGRRLAFDHALDQNHVIPVEGEKLCVFPWLGHVNFNTLTEIINKYIEKDETGDFLAVKKIGGIRPYFITYKTKLTPEEFQKRIRDTVADRAVPGGVFWEGEVRQFKKQCEYKEPKYDKFIPSFLLKKQVIEDYIDINFIKEEIGQW